VAEVPDAASLSTPQIDRPALDAALLGEALPAAMTDAHRHLFSAAVVCVSAAQVAQMQAVIAAVENVVKRDDTNSSSSVRGELVEPSNSLTPVLRQVQDERSLKHKQTSGVFYGYDFHLNNDGAHLIEINTNAGGAFLNALLIASQRAAGLPGKAVADDDLEQTFIAMFRNEWRLARGDAPLNSIAIVDEQPQSQYLYPEFLLAKNLFERAGIAAHIVSPSDLQTREEGLYVGRHKIDLIYNRLTDFSLQHHPHLQTAWRDQRVVLTPDPAHYARYADKCKLALLTDENYLQAAGVSQAGITTLLQGIPQTRLVDADAAQPWWETRKQWFFKPVNGYGGKGAYRGDKITRRVFEEIMRSDYVAQRLAMPGECVVSVDTKPQSFKYDVRCYVYDGRIQLVAARLYQGQTTNFRTPGGGFAMVRVVG
jgi:hypothetical protein